jgi:hypothetical protein
MTEQEWMTCDEPHRMVNFLRGKRERKLRLFFCAGCRGVWHKLDAPLRKAVEVGERYADGSADEQQRRTAQQSICPDPHFSGTDAEGAAFGAVCDGFPVWAIDSAVSLAVEDLILEVTKQGKRTISTDTLRRLRRSHAHLCREIVGNPFRPVRVNPVWLTPTVINLATAASEERALPSGELDPTRLAILADALEEAGCTEAALLEHLRVAGAHHVRGCWAVDLVLGRE